MAGWAAKLGFASIRIHHMGLPASSTSKKAAESQGYCDELLGIASRAGVAITELSTHLQGQLVASHQAYDVLFGSFAPPQNCGRSHCGGRPGLWSN